MNSMHRDLPTSTCEMCGYQTKNIFNFKRHMKRMHTDCRDFQCDTCGFQTKNRYSLERHIQRRHTDCRNFHCDICPKSFKTSSELKVHQAAIHNVGEKEKPVPSSALAWPLRKRALKLLKATEDALKVD